MTDDSGLLAELATWPTGKTDIRLLNYNGTCATVLHSPDEAERVARDLLRLAAEWRQQIAGAQP